MSLVSITGAALSATVVPIVSRLESVTPVGCSKVAQPCTVTAFSDVYRIAATTTFYMAIPAEYVASSPAFLRLSLLRCL